MNIIQNHSRARKKAKKNKAKTPTTPLLTAFQLRFIYNPGALIVQLQERYSLNS
jgi:hypothetical protein